MQSKLISWGFISVSQHRCKVLTVTLRNDALKRQPHISGTYFISDVINGKASWTLKDNPKGYNKAIWYVPKYNDWAIGPLENIGLTIRGLTTFGGQGSLDLFDVPNEKWNAWNGQNWKQVGTNDVTIQCKGKQNF